MMRTGGRLVGAMVLAAVAGCSSEEPAGLTLQSVAPEGAVAATASPSTPLASEAPTSAAASPAGTDEEQAVLDAYIAFYEALARANADPARSQDYLAPVATGVQFDQANGSIKSDYLDGEATVGSPVLNPMVASIEGDTATVRDCQDTTGVQGIDVETQQVLVIGQYPDSVETTLVREDGVWKVSGTVYPDNPAVFC